MIRDPGPIHNIGFGVTSRDIPFNEGEKEGDAPNSGYISRALNGHPLMKFVATTATTLAVSAVLTGVTKKGGLKLAKFAQDRADSGNVFATSVVDSAKSIRRHLDELEGFTRYIDDDTDPYSRLVYELDGQLTTGYRRGESAAGYGFNADERSILTDYGEEVPWAFRDELQQRLVRAGRRLPYELPALYAADKAVVEPLFGEREANERKVKWYNPADVVADFVTESAKNIATMVLPFEFAGAATRASRSSLQSLRHGNYNTESILGNYKPKLHRGFVELSAVLDEVGHDVTKVVDKFIRMSARSSGALSAATEQFKNSKGPVQTMSDLRHGAKEARRRAQASGASRREINKATFDSLFGPSGQRLGRLSDPDRSNLFDLIPTVENLRKGFIAGKKEYKRVGAAQDAMQNAVAFNRVLSESKNLFTGAGDLSEQIRSLQSASSTRIGEIASVVSSMGRGGPQKAGFTKGTFFRDRQRDAFGDAIVSNLVRTGVDEDQARRFIQHLKVEVPQRDSDVTKLITIGKKNIFDKDDPIDFFNQVLKRYQTVTGKKDFERFVDSLGGMDNAARYLRDDVAAAKNNFFSINFQETIKTNAEREWETFYSKVLPKAASGVLSPKKASFYDFVRDENGNVSNAQMDYLRRKSAETLGLKITDESGERVSDAAIQKMLSDRGYNPTNFTELRSFLIRSRKMTSGIGSSDGFNIFGFKQMTVDEARQRGMFDYMRDEERGTLYGIVNTMKSNDPISYSIGRTKLDGVYVNRSNQVLDFTNIKSSIGKTMDFFASEFKIPILNFNPADLFGYRSISQMRSSSPIQYISSNSFQPFVPNDAETRSDFYMFIKGKGTKGKVFGFKNDSIANEAYATELKGSYRSVATQSSELWSRHAKYGADNREAARPYELNPEDRFSTLKKWFRINDEQPNSLFNLFSRFRARSGDLENPNVMASLLRGEEVNMRIGRRRVGARLNTVTDSNGRITGIGLVDADGAAISEIGEDKILGAFERFGRSTFKTGMPKNVQLALKNDPVLGSLFTYFGMSPAEISSADSLRDFAHRIINDAPNVRDRLRRQGIDPAFLDRAISRIRSILTESDLSVRSNIGEQSPTISTRFDELGDEIFRYISQVNPSLQGKDPIEAFVKIEQTISSLKKSGQINAAQESEARASALASLFNFAAFKTYAPSATRSADSRKKLSMILDHASSTKEIGNLFDPYANGDISQISTSIRRKFSFALSPMKKRFGVGPYQQNDLVTDPLGSGQARTLIPTFGTVFERNPMGAILSAAGVTTYSDPQSFSGGSIPMSQGVERLNRYFGSVGLQLDPGSFSGPLGLFAGGMVGRRVLPLYAAGTTFMTADRLLGGYVYNERDDRGERIYTPMITTGAARTTAEIQSLMAGLMPGGMSYEEKREQLLEGEVPIKKGRFWPLGNTPFTGGKTMYYRPSYYRRLKEAPMFTSDTYGSPMEKFLFYNDISPLRPFDPYRFERKHYNDRPYPVSGEYFTGPFGPITPMLNATVGRVLKPQITMHEEELQAGLAQYVPAGQSGAFSSETYGGPAGYFGRIVGDAASVAPPGSMGNARAGIGGYNAQLASQAGVRGLAAGRVRSDIGSQNADLTTAGSLEYGPYKQRGIMLPNIVPAGEPLSPGNITVQSGEIGYRLQEMAGIYGFGFSSLRQSLGLGQGDFEPQRSVLQSASKAYGSTRAFWDLNLGGLGDVPVGSADVGNLEFSEIVRRFIPKERTNVDYINPIKNTMGQMYPFLPGPEYYTDFTTGDPFTKVQEGEMRLPGVGYERFNQLYGGVYGPVNQLDILADVAPYSKEFRKLNRQIDRMDLSAPERIKVEQIRKQQEDVTTKFNFSDYTYKNSSPDDLGISRARYTAGRIGESITHADNFLTNKLFGKRTALEDWERSNVYGATFPQWQRPFEGYIQPMINKATQDNPITAMAGLGAVGALFGRTPKARFFGTAVGATTGLAASAYGNAREAITGERFIPKTRKKELALEEYSDILSYVKNTRLASQAQAEGDYGAAFDFRQAAKRTMYGADVYSGDAEQLAFSLPKRKREHFKALVQTTDMGERKQILSTAGRLERRFYQAAWGMKVEEKPDLVDYFSRHELPDEGWEGWSAGASSDHMKIKMGQNMGLEMSQMGYYPQQIRQANLVNMSYPEFGAGEDRQDVLYKLRGLMSSMGITGSVNSYSNPFGSDQYNVSAGVR